MLQVILCGFLHTYFVFIFGLKMASWRPIFAQSWLLRYLLRATSNIYEKQTHQSSGKSNYEFDILKGVVINLLEITKSANRHASEHFTALFEFSTNNCFVYFML